MVKVRVKIKTPSKTQIKRNVTKAIRKSLVCPACGHKLPYTNMSKVRCSRCGRQININV